MNTSALNISLPHPPPQEPDVLQITMLIVVLVAFIVTMITNLITIIVIVRTSALRTCTNAFLVSFAASDILYALIMTSFIAITLLYHFFDFRYDQEDLATTTSFAWGVLIHSSNGNLILVSLERWLYITHPFWYQRHVTARTALISISITWLSAFVCNLPYVFLETGARSTYFVIWHAYVYPAVHTACCLMLFVIYTHISVTTVRQLQKIAKTKLQHRHGHDNSSDLVGMAAAYSRRSSTYAENWKAVKLLITIFGLYFLCVSPYVYFFAYTQTHPTALGELVPLCLYFFFLFLLSFHHCSNFFVYVWRIRKFRAALKISCSRACCCCCSYRSNRVGYQNESGITATVFELQTRRITTEIGEYTM